MRGIEKFYSEYYTYPGEIDEQVETDIPKLKVNYQYLEYEFKKLICSLLSYCPKNYYSSIQNLYKYPCSIRTHFHLLSFYTEHIHYFAFFSTFSIVIFVIK